MIEGFGLNTIDYAEVDRFLGYNRERQEEQEGEFSHYGSIQREEAGRGPEQERESERPPTRVRTLKGTPSMKFWHGAFREVNALKKENVLAGDRYFPK